MGPRYFHGAALLHKSQEKMCILCNFVVGRAGFPKISCIILSHELDLLIDVSHLDFILSLLGIRRSQAFHR